MPLRGSDCSRRRSRFQSHSGSTEHISLYLCSPKRSPVLISPRSKAKALSIHPDGQFLATASVRHDSSLLHWRGMPSGQRLARIVAPPRCLARANVIDGVRLRSKSLRAPGQYSQQPSAPPNQSFVAWLMAVTMKLPGVPSLIGPSIRRAKTPRNKIGNVARFGVAILQPVTQRIVRVVRRPPNFSHRAFRRVPDTAPPFRKATARLISFNASVSEL